MSAVIASDSVAFKLTGVTYTPPGGSPQSYIPLKVKSYSITLNKAQSPYVDATIVVTTPEIGAVALMDPTTLTLRGYVTLTKTGVRPSIAEVTRNYDLMVRSVANDAATGETTLGLSSDEGYLIIDRYAAAAVDTTYRADQASLRSIVSAVLATYGFTLASSPSVDADYTITTNRTNLILNPSAEVDATNTVGGSCTIARSTAQHFIGSACFALTATASGGIAFTPFSGSSAASATAGEIFTLTGYVRTAATARNVNGRIRFFNSAGTQIGSDVLGATVTETSTGWQRVSVTATAPTGAATVYAYLSYTASATSEVHYVDAVMLCADNGLEADGTTVVPYFDGSLAADTHYTYAWTGTANASTSTKTRLDARDPNVLDRIPGSAVWDWLNGLVQTPGYRLFCDEQRVWRMVDNSYAVAGSIALTQAINLTQGVDTIDVGQADTDGNGYVQKVVVIYQWIDRTTAANMTAYDYAGSGHGPGITITVNTPYPGPGYAAAVLARMQGRAHVLALSALSDLNTTPGNDVTASLPSLAETGKIASVTWTEADEMTVGTEGLVTIPANAWSLAVGAWSAATGTWAGATGTN